MGLYRSSRKLATLSAAQKVWLLVSQNRLFWPPGIRPGWW
jgi:hypothetical protein